MASLGNGAAMRVAPVAVRFFEDTVVLDAQARASARVTHAHPVGIDGAAVQAAAVAAALEGRDPLAAALSAAATHELAVALAELRAATAGGLTPQALGSHGGVPATAGRSVAAAVVAAAGAATFEDAVSTAIRAGGDTDTTGATAGAIAGARFGAFAIPARWRDALEDGPRGRTHVERLARQLADLAARPTMGGAT